MNYKIKEQFKIHKVVFFNSKNGIITTEFEEMDLKERENNFLTQKSAKNFIEKNIEKFAFLNLVILFHINIIEDEKKQDKSSIQKRKSK